MLARLRHTKTSTRVLVAAIAIAVAFAAIAVALHLKPYVVGPVEGALFFVITGAALVRARFERGVIVILLAGLGFYFAYLGYTSFGERNYDGGPQLQYIEYIAQHHERPPANHCLICHHPPLYYGTGALVFAACKATRLVEPAQGLQLFGLVLFMVFLGYGVRTAERLLRDRRDVRLATALMVFWPYSVHNSVRLHNDSMVCAWMAAAVFHVVRWAQEERPRDLYLAAGFTALGLLTKSSAYALVPVLLALLAVRFFRSQDKLRFTSRGLVAVSILAGALLLNARGKETPKMKDAPLCHKILGNACDIEKGLLVGNKITNYVYLDLPSFVKEPYALAQREGSGRQYFWNHLLKSSLFGTHNTVADRETAYELNRVVAGIMNVLMLGMIAYLGAGLVTLRKRGLRRWAVVILNLASCLAFMIGFRALIPAPHHSDFRHVFHAVILVSIAYAATVAHFRARRPALAQVGRILAIPFLGLSIFYFTPKHDLAVRLTRRVVRYNLAAFARVVPENTPWDKQGNLIIETNHILEFTAASPKDASELDVTFDGNDRYEIEIEGETTKKLVVGPAKKKVTGLARYVEKLDPPVRAVRRVRVRPRSGDLAYSMGHLILR
ncbi:MAG: glycosyltransferase family 39 protein [Minicystis sp.]